MIQVEQKPYGFKIIFTGIISEKEVNDWHTESAKLLDDAQGCFSVFVDMRKMEILPVNCRDKMYHGQKMFKRMGMERSVVIVRDKLTAMQFRLIAQKTGIYADERYINASYNHNWEEDGINWISNAIEPVPEEELA